MLASLFLHDARAVVEAEDFVVKVGTLERWHRRYFRLVQALQVLVKIHQSVTVSQLVFRLGFVHEHVELRRFFLLRQKLNVILSEAQLLFRRLTRLVVNAATVIGLVIAVLVEEEHDLLAAELEEDVEFGDRDLEDVVVVAALLARRELKREFESHLRDEVIFAPEVALIEDEVL